MCVMALGGGSHIEDLGHLREVEVSLLAVEALQLSGVLILAFLGHVTPQMGLLLGLRGHRGTVGCRVVEWPASQSPPRRPVGPADPPPTPCPYTTEAHTQACA